MTICEGAHSRERDKKIDFGHRLNSLRDEKVTASNAKVWYRVQNIKRKFKKKYTGRQRKNLLMLIEKWGGKEKTGATDIAK